MAATLAVSVLPGLAAGSLQAIGVIGSWAVAAALAIVTSLAIGAAGSVWWSRRPASRDVVFSDLMLWGWLRRRRVEKRLSATWWLLGHPDDLDAARHTELLQRLSDDLEARDSYTHGHSRRVTRHAYAIAQELGLPDDEAARIRTAAAVHDVGKIETPREILNKPDRLTDEEFEVIKRHPVEGAAMVAALGDPELTRIVRHHHERLDGGGYPDGLVGDEIPRGSRVIAVADTFDALTSSRSYRTGASHKKALDVLRAESGHQLDPVAVDAFLAYYSGRRMLPVWSAVSAAPARLVSWLVSGLEGATIAPLGGGAAAFLVGATLAGSLAQQQLTGVEARADDVGASVAADAGGGAAGGAAAGAGGPAALGGIGGPGLGSGGENGGSQGGPGGGGGPSVPPVDTPDTPPIRTPDVGPVEPPDTPPIRTPDVGPVETPDVPPIRTPDLPPVQTPDLPPVQTPDLPSIRTPDLPQIRTPDLPRTELPDLPPIDVPDLPPVDVPDLPPIDLPDLPRIDLPGGG